MVNIMMGPEGSGKTKLLIGALNQAVQRESGSIVCIEKGDTLRFDVDHKVRLIDIKEYAYGGYPFLRGFISGLHAGNFDITHIFIDNLYKLSQDSDPKETENFLDWCSVFSAENSVAFTLTIAAKPRMHRNISQDIWTEFEIAGAAGLPQRLLNVGRGGAAWSSRNMRSGAICARIFGSFTSRARWRNSSTGTTIPSTS